MENFIVDPHKYNLDAHLIITICDVGKGVKDFQVIY